MSICIPAADARGLEGKVHGHFGSAPYYVIHDPHAQETEVLPNTNAHHAHGACRPLAALEGRTIQTIIVGGIGRRAVEHLNRHGIAVFGAVAGTVQENLDKLQAGRLENIAPDAACAGHGG